MRLTGEWPGRVHIRTRWGSADGRPRNHLTDDALLHVRRRSERLVRAATSSLHGLGAPAVFSPPLPSEDIGAWRQVDYRPYARFVVMRGSLERPIPRATSTVTVASSDSLARAVEVDQSSFPAEWQYDEECLRDALHATPHHDLLVSEDEGTITGYGVVGLAGPQGYLQRIAVEPRYRGQGVGASILRTGMQWARNRGARMLVLNTQIDNHPAGRLYRREGFTEDLESLVVLRHDRDSNSI